MFFEGVIDYKTIRGIHRKIQANTSTIQSELGGPKVDQWLQMVDAEDIPKQKLLE